nr:transcription factor CPC [Tanacetum cinerariifolium]
WELIAGRIPGRTPEEIERFWLMRHSEKQTVVATSLTKAEYVAAASGCAQVLWMQNQLLDYGDSPILGVNTPRSDEDRLKLMELMVFLLQRNVCEEIGINVARLSMLLLSGKQDVAEDVVHMATPSPPPHGNSSPPQEPSLPPYQPPCPPQPQDAEQLEIVKLKARVKKLEKINMVKSSKLRRLKKVRTSQRVKSSDDMENVFNQGRIIVDMDHDEGIELDHSSKVLSMQEDYTEVQEAVKIVTNAKLMTEVVIAAAIQVVPASTPILAAKPKILNIVAAHAVSTRRRKGVVIRDPEEELPFDTSVETPKVKDKGKGILIEAPKRMKKKDQIEMDAEYARKLQEEINIEHEETYKNIDWNATLDHVQSKEPQYIKRYHGMKKKPQTEFKARKNMIFYLKNTEVKIGNGSRRSEIIKSINKTPTQKAAKRRKLNEYLLLTLKTMFEEPNGQDAIWRYQKSVHGLALVKRWKLLTSCGVHVITLLTVQLFLLVERRYPLSRFTLEHLVNVARLQVEEESEMYLELLRFTR